MTRFSRGLRGAPRHMGSETPTRQDLTTTAGWREPSERGVEAGYVSSTRYARCWLSTVAGARYRSARRATTDADAVQRTVSHVPTCPFLDIDAQRALHGWHAAVCGACWCGVQARRRSS